MRSFTCLQGAITSTAGSGGKFYEDNMGTIQNPNKLYPGQELFGIVDADWEPPFNLDEYVETWRPYLLSGSAP